MKWSSIKDGLPATSRRCWVTHEVYYPHYSIEALYDGQTGCFIYAPHRNDMPCSVPLQVTHYIEIPFIERISP